MACISDPLVEVELVLLADAEGGDGVDAQVGGPRVRVVGFNAVAALAGGQLEGERKDRIVWGKQLLKCNYPHLHFTQLPRRFVCIHHLVE